MIKKRFLSMLVLLAAVVTGAVAEDTYNVTFRANGNTKVVENVTLPHTFWCNYNGSIGVGDGELDLIIQQLYGFSGGWCDESSPWMDNAVSGVTVGISSDNQYFSISTPFEGTAQVKGWYYRGWEDDFEYTLDIAIASPEPAEPEAQENVTIIFNDLGLDNAYDLTSGPLTVGNIELNFDKADGSNPPAFYTSGGGTARLYKGNTMSVDAGGATITKIVFTYASDVTPTFSTGSYNATTKTWEGEATTLTVTNAYTTNTQIRIKSMDVYYSVASAAGEATYTVTLKEGTEDADKWTITPAEATTTGVAQGTEITATYSGTKLVKSVKATKKVAGPTAYTLAESTQGMIVGTDGKAYDVADKDNLPTGVTAAGVVVYKDGANGLAIALTDEASTMDWATACGENGAAAHMPAVEGLTWKLPSQEEWTLVKDANSASALNSAITSAGGTAIPTPHFDPETSTMTGQYWLSTENGSDLARIWAINGYDEIVVSNADQDLKTNNNLVRACLAW